MDWFNGPQAPGTTPGEIGGGCSRSPMNGQASSVHAAPGQASNGYGIQPLAVRDGMS